MSKVYTKKGDNGTTSLLSGDRIRKNTPTIRAVGALDELNSFIGLLRSEIFTMELLEKIQWNLFNAGAEVINDNNTQLTTVSEDDILELEQEMDKMDAQLPPLKNFILPYGNRVISLTHICRSVCRRAELECIGVASTTITKYLNRLSDFFFVLARFIGYNNYINETIWKND